ncbi:hypothetical protein [Marinibactrum halimedae]|nr:hypothetical protein [Marinibactrum halimedae]MCD9459517.1 hypothetical protein [Marinibactrum halimedae]
MFNVTPIFARQWFYCSQTIEAFSLSSRSLSDDFLHDLHRRYKSKFDTEKAEIARVINCCDDEYVKQWLTLAQVSSVIFAPYVTHGFRYNKDYSKRYFTVIFGDKRIDVKSHEVVHIYEDGQVEFIAASIHSGLKCLQAVDFTLAA